LGSAPSSAALLGGDGPACSIEYSRAGDPLYGDPVGEASLGEAALAGLASRLASFPAVPSLAASEL